MTTAADQTYRKTLLPILTSDRFFGFCVRLARDPSRAEDLVQTVALKAWRYRESFGEPGLAWGWLTAIARNEIRNAARDANRWRTQAETVAGDPTRELATIPSYEDQLDAEVEAKLAMDAIAGLPEHYRETIELREFEELSYVEIAKRQGVSVGTVMSRLYRGRWKIASAMGQAAA